MVILFHFLRTDLLPWGCGNRCFLVPLYSLIVRKPNLEVEAKGLLHQQVIIPVSCHTRKNPRYLTTYIVRCFYCRQVIKTAIKFFSEQVKYETVPTIDTAKGIFSWSIIEYPYYLKVKIDYKKIFPKILVPQSIFITGAVFSVNNSLVN